MGSCLNMCGVMEQLMTELMLAFNKKTKEMGFLTPSKKETIEVRYPSQIGCYMCALAKLEES